MKKLQVLLFPALLISLLFYFGCKSNTDSKELANALESLNKQLDSATLAPPPPPVDTFESTAGNFKIMFPGTPTDTSYTIPTEIGDIEFHQYIFEKSITEAYMVAFSDYPSAMVKATKIKELLQQSKSGVLSSLGETGKVAEEKPIKIDQHEGLFLKADNGTLFLYYKMFVVKNRLYQIGIMKDGSYPTDEAVQSFIESFALVTK